MDIFDYIALSNPTGCAAVCRKYGFEPQAQDEAELADCLTQLVQEVGEPALSDLVLLHPDRELILEQQTVIRAVGATGESTYQPQCNCPKCRGVPGPASENLIHSTQVQGAQHFFQVNQAGMFIIGGLVLVALAVISKN